MSRIGRARGKGASYFFYRSCIGMLCEFSHGKDRGCHYMWGSEGVVGLRGRIMQNATEKKVEKTWELGYVAMCSKS